GRRRRHRRWRGGVRGRAAEPPQAPGRSDDALRGRRARCAPPAEVLHDARGGGGRRRAAGRGWVRVSVTAVLLASVVAQAVAPPPYAVESVRVRFTHFDQRGRGYQSAAGPAGTAGSEQLT